MKYAELKKIFRKHELDRPASHLTAHIVFTADSFEEDCSLLSRVYAVSSDNKAFQPNMGGYSIYAACLDGRDNGVRLEWYMAEEKGGSAKGKWKVESCYILEYMRDAAAVSHYERTPQSDGTVCYSFGDTMIRVKESDLDGRIQFEPVGGKQTVCGEWGKLDFTLDVVAGYCTLLSRVINKESGDTHSGGEKEAAPDESIDIIVEVKGGIVQTVYATNKNVGVEVIDLDAPDFATPEELKEYDQLQERMDDIRKSDGWHYVW